MRPLSGLYGPFNDHPLPTLCLIFPKQSLHLVFSAFVFYLCIIIIMAPLFICCIARFKLRLDQRRALRGLPPLRQEEGVSLAEQAHPQADWRPEVENFHVDNHEDQLIKQRVLNLINDLFRFQSIMKSMKLLLLILICMYNY